MNIMIRLGLAPKILPVVNNVMDVYGPTPEGVELDTTVAVTGCVRTIPDTTSGNVFPTVTVPVADMVLTVTKGAPVSAKGLKTVTVGLPVICTGALGSALMVMMPETGTAPLPTMTVGLPVTETVLTVVLMVKPVTEIGPTIDTAPVTLAGSVKLAAREPDMLNKDKSACPVMANGLKTVTTGDPVMATVLTTVLTVKPVTDKALEI